MMVKLNSKIKIGIDIRNILTSDSGLTSYVGNKIFPQIAPENTTGNFIFYFNDNAKNIYSSFGAYQQTSFFHIITVSESYDDVLTISDLIYNLVEGTHIDKYNYYYMCNLSDSGESLSDKKYITELVFSVN